MTDKGLMRESIQVTIAMPLDATPVSSLYLKLFTYSSFAASASLNASLGKWPSFIVSPNRSHECC